MTQHRDSEHDNGMDAQLEAQGGRVRRPSLHASSVTLEPLPDPAAAHPLRLGNGGREDDGTESLATVPPAILATIADVRERNRAARAAGQVALIPFPTEVVEHVRREWVAGLRSVSAIAREYGLPRPTIIAWAQKHGWGERSDERRDSVRSKITAELIARTAARVAPVTVEDADGNPVPAPMTVEDAQRDPEKAAQAMVDDYAAVVANVVQRMRDTSGIAVETGRTLLDEYQATLSAVMVATRGNRVQAAKALAGLTSTYKTLVAALHTAYQLQRQSYGLDAREEDRPPGAGPESLGGTYEDAVREAEERGIALDS